jgi:hypothetical protein
MTFWGLVDAIVLVLTTGRKTCVTSYSDSATVVVVANQLNNQYSYIRKMSFKKFHSSIHD